MYQITIIGIFAALISTASWAVCSIILKKLGEKLDPVGMTAFKSILSVIYLSLFLFFTGGTFFVEKDILIPIAISGFVGITLGDSLFFAALSRLSPFFISIILFAGPDIFSGLFGFFMLKEMPSFIEWVAIFCILAGVSFFVFPIEKQNASENKSTIIGIILALLSLVCMAYSMAIIKPVLTEISTITATMYRMLFSALTLIIFAFFSKKLFSWKNALQDMKYNLKFSGTILVATFGGFLMSLVAIKYCELIVASTLMALEPLFILIFMIIFSNLT